MKRHARKPDFFIVGAPKSGTTALAHYLNQHPDIFIPRAKDSHFFGSDLHFLNNINHPPNLFRVSKKTYLSWYSGRREKRLGEASVLYLYSRKAATEIKDFSPDANVIIMLRNPVDMIYSLHGHFLTDLNEDIEDFGDALSAEEERKRGEKIPDTVYSIDGLFYRDVAKYAEQIERYFEVFGHDKVHIMIFDDLKNSTAEIYRKTLRFLGVSDDFQPDFEVVNPAKQLRSRRLQRLIISPPSIFMPLGQKLARLLWFSRLVKTTLFFFNVKQERRPSMDPGTRRQLLEEFAPEIDRLGRLLARDLSDWRTN
jgi:hypothetical protein